MDFDLDSLLTDILDDDKPLPVAAPKVTITPTPPEPPATRPEATEVNPGLTLADVVAEALREPVGQMDAFPALLPKAPEPAPSKYVAPTVLLPSFTTDEIAESLDLRNFATMTTLNTRRWAAKVKDRKASEDVAAANDAEASAFETRKKLLAGADDLLKAVHKSIDQARAKYYDMTLPWTTTGLTDAARRSGARIMPNTQFTDFISEMGKCKADMEAALDKFVPAYPALVQEAQKKLGKRFDITEYPNPSSIREHFGLSFDFQPIPEGKDFKGLPDAQCKALATALQGKTKKMLENAMQDLWARVYEVVARMAERLSHPDKMFHYTLVDNVRLAANQLKNLNITDDARVRGLQQDIESRLCQHEADALRDNPVLRTKVGADARDIIERMDAMAKRGYGSEA